MSNYWKKLSGMTQLELMIKCQQLDRSNMILWMVASALFGWFVADLVLS